MILSDKLVTAALLLVAWAVFIDSVEPATVDVVARRHIQDERIVVKRQVDDLPLDELPSKAHHSLTQATEAPKPADGGDSRAALPSRKHGHPDKARKSGNDMKEGGKNSGEKSKGADNAASEKTTTKKPRSTKSHKKDTKSPKTKDGKKDEKKDEKKEDKKDEKKDEKKEDKKDDKKGDKKDDKKGDDKEKSGKSSSTTKAPVSDGRPHKRVMGTEEKLRVANERWLQNQETVAIEHMLAGVYDWMKVLKQTKGKTFNKLKAGELLDKVKNELAGMLSEANKPDKLISLSKKINAE